LRDERPVVPLGSGAGEHLEQKTKIQVRLESAGLGGFDEAVERGGGVVFVCSVRKRLRQKYRPQKSRDRSTWRQRNRSIPKLLRARQVIGFRSVLNGGFHA